MKKRLVFYGLLYTLFWLASQIFGAAQVGSFLEKLQEEKTPKTLTAYLPETLRLDHP